MFLCSELFHKRSFAVQSVLFLVLSVLCVLCVWSALRTVCCVCLLCTLCVPCCVTKAAVLAVTLSDFNEGTTKTNLKLITQVFSQIIDQQTKNNWYRFGGATWCCKPQSMHCLSAKGIPIHFEFLCAFGAKTFCTETIKCCDRVWEVRGRKFSLGNWFSLIQAIDLPAQCSLWLAQRGTQGRMLFCILLALFSPYTGTALPLGDNFEIANGDIVKPTVN